MSWLLNYALSFFYTQPSKTKETCVESTVDNAFYSSVVIVSSNGPLPLNNDKELVEIIKRNTDKTNETQSTVVDIEDIVKSEEKLNKEVKLDSKDEVKTDSKDEVKTDSTDEVKTDSKDNLVHIESSKKITIATISKAFEELRKKMNDKRKMN